MATLKLTAEQYAELEVRAQYPLMHAAQIFFGPEPKKAEPDAIHNGTVTLIRVRGRQLGITNWHVVHEYRECAKTGGPLLCYVGNVEVDLTQLVIDESAWYDLATLDLTKVDASKIRGGKEIPCQYWEAREWPPKLPAPKEFLMFGGFPLSRRKRHALDQIEFGAVSSGGTEVRTVQEDLITAQIAFDECIVAFDDVGNGFPELPGISGGPVMQLRTSNMGLELFEMIGVIFEHHEAYDSLRVRPLSLIDEQGKITKPPMQYNVVSQRRD